MGEYSASEQPVPALMFISILKDRGSGVHYATDFQNEKVAHTNTQDIYTKKNLESNWRKKHTLLGLNFLPLKLKVSFLKFWLWAQYWDFRRLSINIWSQNVMHEHVFWGTHTYCIYYCGKAVLQLSVFISLFLFHSVYFRLIRNLLLGLYLWWALINRN